ncbi:MAG: hypothetical protein ACRCXT_20685 [Paraclostridium sp.]
MKRNLLIKRNVLKNTIINELNSMDINKINKIKVVLNNNKTIEGDKITVDREAGNIHIFNNEKQVYVYNFSMSESKDITITVEDIPILNRKIKNIERSDIDEVLKIMYR